MNWCIINGTVAECVPQVMLFSPEVIILIILIVGLIFFAIGMIVSHIICKN